MAEDDEGKLLPENLLGELERLQGLEKDHVGVVVERDAALAKVTELEAAQAPAAAELAAAKAEVAALKAAAARVPSGDNGRQVADLSGLSPEGKIRAGLAARQSS